MVRKKKIAKKDAGDAPKVTFVEEPTIATATTAASLLTDYQTLLADAPEVPHIANVEDAVKFVDKYAKWKQKVKAAT